jgi:hypothetical protein
MGNAVNGHWLRLSGNNTQYTPSLAQLLLATVNGQLVRFNTGTLELTRIFQTHEDNALMGLCGDNDLLFVAGLSSLFSLRKGDFSLERRTRNFLPSLGLHQMNIYDGKLFATATKRNQIWIFDRQLRRTGKIRIAPPLPNKRIRYKKNYNHINNIISHKGAFYINLNWFTDKQYAESGVLVCDKDFRELDRFKFAWESHDFQFIDGKMTAICSTSGRDKKILHPKSSGLMVDGKLVWEHDPDESFCKALCHDRQFIYMCGGMKALRAKRKYTAGVIYVIDKKDYSLVRKITKDGMMGIRGAMLLETP